MNKLKNRKGVSTFEIAIVIAVICAALIAMAPALGRRAKAYIDSNSQQLGQYSWGASAVQQMDGTSTTVVNSDASQATTNQDSNTNQNFTVGAYP